MAHPPVGFQAAEEALALAALATHVEGNQAVHLASQAPEVGDRAARLVEASFAVHLERNLEAAARAMVASQAVEVPLAGACPLAAAFEPTLKCAPTCASRRHPILQRTPYNTWR